jgi:TolA-binding protein
MKDDKTGVAVLAALATDYPKFQAADEVHVDLAAGCVRIADWETLDRHYRSFMEAFKASPRRPYIDLYHALRLLAGGQTDEAVARLGSLAKADTYQDLKADAYYHLARHMLSQAPAQQETVFDMLEKSVYHYPRAESLLAAGRAALALGKWSDARRYLDRCVREFPKSEETVLRDARVLLAKVAEEEVRKR